jgi:hypothetical protein
MKKQKQKEKKDKSGRWMVHDGADAAHGKSISLIVVEAESHGCMFMCRQSRREREKGKV